MLFSGFLAAQSATMLPPKQFSEQLQAVSGAQLIDVRTPQEYAGGHLPGAKLISLNARNFEQQIQQLDNARPIFIYCARGGRSANAGRRLLQMGFTQVYDLRGGITEWISQGFPVKR